MTTQPEPIHPSPDTRWYVDYHCDDCGQQGTARFHGKDMQIRTNGLVEPIPTIFCCICRCGNNLYYDDIECYDCEVDDEEDGLRVISCGVGTLEVKSP